MPEAFKILTVQSGEYEDYQCDYYYVPLDFSWAVLATELEGRKRRLNPERKHSRSRHEVMELAIRAMGGRPVEAHFTVNIDDLRISYDHEKLSYEPADRFIARLKERTSCRS